MTGFFLIIIGFVVVMIRGTVDINKRAIADYDWVQEKIKYALNNNKAVYQDGYKNNQPLYYDIRTKNQVYKGIGKDGLHRWYYVNTNGLLQYPIDSGLINNLNFNVYQAKQNNKKWCVLENFWEDSIIRLENNKKLANTYLDDFTVTSNPIEEYKWTIFRNKWNHSHDILKGEYSGCKYTYSIYVNTSEEQKRIIEQYFNDNDPLNQKIYLKHMRPYQLYMIVKEGEYSNTPYKQKQYLIRFGNDNLKLNQRHCITEKQAKYYWTKWYAITESEYNSLTNTNHGILSESYHLNSSLAVELNLRKINYDTIAFNNMGIDWNMPNAGIKRAFDKQGNFIG